MMNKPVETSAAGKNRLPSAEVARWVVAAAHHGVREAWMAQQPVLLLSEPPQPALSLATWPGPPSSPCRSPVTRTVCSVAVVYNRHHAPACSCGSAHDQACQWAPTAASDPAVLCAGYLMEHAPGLGMYVLRRIGPKRAQALKAGGSGYDVGGLLRK
jgi:hypothetical protein